MLVRTVLPIKRKGVPQHHESEFDLNTKERKERIRTTIKKKSKRKIDSSQEEKKKKVQKKTRFLDQLQKLLQKKKYIVLKTKRKD